ncbi:MAG: hypothetical protein RJP95_01420 [Pirellulales bacterium]
MLCGCSETPESHDVTGQVLVNDAPGEGVYVAVYRIGDDADGNSHSARTRSDGTFSLSVPATGQYAVTAFWPSEEIDEDTVIEGPDRFGGRYRNPLQPVTTVIVNEGQNQIETIMLEEEQ